MIRPNDYSDDSYFQYLTWSFNQMSFNTTCNFRMCSDPGFSGGYLNRFNFNRSGKSGMIYP